MLLTSHQDVIVFCGHQKLGLSCAVFSRDLCRCVSVSWQSCEMSVRLRHALLSVSMTVMQSGI